VLCKVTFDVIYELYVVIDRTMCGLCVFIIEQYDEARDIM